MIEKLKDGDKLNICPECGCGNFHIEGRNLQVNYLPDDRKMALVADESGSFQDLSVECQNCNTWLKPTMTGFKKIEPDANI